MYLVFATLWIAPDRKRKTRCKTADSMIVLGEQKSCDWSDGDDSSDHDWLDMPDPSEPSYKKARRLSPKKTKTAQPKLKPMRKKVSRQPRKKGALDEDV